MNDLERRSLADCRVSSEDGRHLKGYAIRFHALSQDLGGFRELIDPAAVDRTLNQALDVRALVDHDSGKIIGRTRAGTLTLSKDANGLRFDIEPDDQITYARDVMRAVSRGDISGMSFGFRTLEDNWNYEDLVPVRTVLDMIVSEVSVVAFPAYPQTDVSVAQRSLATFQRQQGNRVGWLTRKLKTSLAK